MRIIFILATMILLISFTLMMISSSISMKTLTDQEKSSPFECGFDPKVSSRLPFSMHFFLIAVIFLVFDVEIALLLPLIIILQWSKIMLWSIISTFFLVILLLGLYHEWRQGALDWAK
uniref:NADH-ubiquinone oxidoreductase chain 3 n=1 Tax=Orophyllus montanus TaxID=948394 RepID=A0A1Q1MP30_9ORTH|nr:NADH dehydrogenase subunit 3 [Orophyllus montanus]